MVQRLPTRMVDYSSLPDGPVQVVAGELVNVPSGGGSSTLDGLTDVDVSTAPPGEWWVLAFDETTGGWEGRAITADALGTGAVGDGSLILYDNLTWGPPPSGSGSSSGGGLFRGAWEADAPVVIYDFAGGIPTEFTKSFTGVAVDPVTASVTEATGTPGTYTTAVKLANKNVQNTNASRLDLNLSTLGIAGITRAKMWLARTSGSYSSNTATRVYKGAAKVHETTGQLAWYETEVACTSTDTLRFEGAGTHTASAATTSSTMLTGLVIYAAQNPYKVGEVVVHKGRLWKCLTASTGAEPSSTAADWSEIPLGPRGSTAQRPTALGGSFPYFDETLDKPIWKNSAGTWVDATGTPV